MISRLKPARWISLMLTAAGLLLNASLGLAQQASASATPATPPAAALQSDSDPEVVPHITELLIEQTAAWNAGDLEKFMQTYWKSEHLTFSSGGQTTRGWDATLKRYQQRYAPPNEMGTLRFERLEYSMLGTEAVLVLGKWHLTMQDESTRDGNFSLVIKKMDNGWKIIHDHSSERKQP